jgi:transposase
MAKYKHTEAENGQGMFLSVNLIEQLLPGTFEYMLNDLIGKRLDISMFDKNYNNDKTGARAIPPRVLLKLIIYGYSKGIKSSRGIDELSRNNIIAKALSEDIEPHWTTIADFISGNNEIFKEVFIKVLAYCAELNLICGETFAEDGCRIPSNASIELTGTKEDLEKRLKIYRRMAEKHIAKHKRNDEKGHVDGETERRYRKQQKKLKRNIEKISNFLENIEIKEGRRVKETKSNVTDNESALILASDGYIQGYIGLAVSDKKEQIIVNAEAVGSANEGEHFPRMLGATMSNLEEAGIKRKKKIKMLADKNYFSEENLKASKEQNVEAIIADRQYKQRLGDNKNKRYEADDFKYYKEGNYYKCPNRKKLVCKGSKKNPEGDIGMVYQASIKDCRNCQLSAKCLKSKREISKLDRGRSLFITESNSPGSLSVALRKKLNTQEYQDQYAYRIQIIEPVFSNITYCKKLDRFSLRGAKKVNGQWQLYCMVHNLGKCLKGYNKKKGYA